MSLRSNRRKLVLALLGVLLLQGCADTGQRAGAPVGARTSPARAAPELTGASYTVTKGDTLYSIAFRAGVDYRALAATNDIADPYVIRPGQRLRLRPLAAPTTARPAPAGAASPARAVVRRPPGSARPPAARPRTAPQPAVPGVARPDAPAGSAPPAAERPGNTTTPRFTWPAPGRVVQPVGGGSKGVDIAGRLGEPVLAAADGEVVYAGSGLRGYGNLLIIKHDDIYLSAYGHNERLLVREGDRVKARQKIAEIGIDGSGAARLHFEVRRAGSPVDPLRYLPSK